MTVDVDDGGLATKVARLRVDLEVGHLELVVDPASRGLAEEDPVILVEELRMEGAGSLAFRTLNDDENEKPLAVDVADDDGNVRRCLEGDHHQVAEVLHDKIQAGGGERTEVNAGLVPVADILDEDFDAVLFLEGAKLRIDLGSVGLERTVVLVDEALQAQLAAAFLQEVHSSLRATPDEACCQRGDIGELVVGSARLRDDELELDGSVAHDVADLVEHVGAARAGSVSHLGHELLLHCLSEDGAAAGGATGLGQ
mmetsp:Transcript_13903/g.37352  ORF Transcript_13903/g.37352 Transcript_13903/m.37352 type:complete len:255 (-) Transcript_13903:637-1401(-)